MFRAEDFKTVSFFLTHEELRLVDLASTEFGGTRSRYLRRIVRAAILADAENPDSPVSSVPAEFIAKVKDQPNS